MLIRTNPPVTREINEIKFEEPKIASLNNVPFYHMAEVPNETCRFDLYFDAGKIHGKHSIASIVNGLLLAGTIDKNTNEINEAINSLGAYYESGISMENAVVSIYCLSENLINTVEIVVDAISGVVFPEHELSEYLSDRRQQFNIGLKKVSFNAQRAFQKQLFSSVPVYSRVTELEDFENIKREELIEFHQNNYLNGLSKVVLVGNISDEDKNRLKELVCSFQRSKIEEEGTLINSPNTSHLQIKDAVQSAIRIGRILFTKEHPDYLDFLILNTILGDYFGSRLMTNIREDKGYTYGIGSHLVEFKKSGYFVIGTEVKKDVRDAAINEIKIELERLQNELISEIEIQLVQNYMLGQLLKSADGPYAMMDLFLSSNLHNKDLEFYNEAIHAIQTITPERLQKLAKKYLNWADMTVISAG